MKNRRTKTSKLATETPVVVDREGGNTGAGLIRGVSVVTKGEALGHGLWLDSQFVEDTAEALESSQNGVKVRFTHPDMCSDGMGKYLGRLYYSSHDDLSVKGDLHFAKSAHNTPEGNLAEYVMQMAEEDPDMFGTSIVFERDFEMEEEFLDQNSGDEGFQSPDDRNKSQYRHARLALLKACDVVDSPAANPSGLFHDPIHNEALAIANYVVGISEELPYLSKFEIGPDKVKGFIDSYLSRHNLKIVSLDEDNDMTIQAFRNKKAELLEEDKPEAPVDETQEEVTDEVEQEESAEDEAPVDETEDVEAEAEEEKEEEAAEVSASSFKAQLKKYTDAFGEKNGLAWFQDGISFDEGCSRQLAAQRDEIAKLQKQVKTLKSGAAPVSFSEKGKSADKPTTEKKSLREAGIVRLASK